MVNTALQQRHHILQQTRLPLHPMAIEQIKADRQDWMAGDVIVGDDQRAMLEDENRVAS